MSVTRFRRRHQQRPELGINGRNALMAGIVLVFVASVGLVRYPADAGETSNAAMSYVRKFTGTATRVVDGDTFYINSKATRIRVWGLDAPEVGSPGGPRATAALTRLIAGKNLTCRQRDTDRYGRIVGQCFLADGRDITAAMIASRTAREYCRYSRNHYRTC